VACSWCTDFAYSDTAFDGYRPPRSSRSQARPKSLLSSTLTKSFSMAGWRVAFLVGNAEIVQGLTKLKSYLDYGTFQPIQIAADRCHERGTGLSEVRERYLPGAPRRPLRRAAARRLGRAQAQGHMFVWAKIQGTVYQEMGSLGFSKFLVTEAKVRLRQEVVWAWG